MNKKQINLMQSIGYLSDSYLPSNRANTVHVLKMCSAFAHIGMNVTLFCNKQSDYDINKIRKAYNIDSNYNIIAVPAKLKGKLQLLEFAFRKRNLIIQEKYDICYGRSLLALFLIRNKLPFIYESHILPNRGIFVRLERMLLKNKNCHGLIVISQSLKEEYLKMFPFLKRKDVTVLHDGADAFDGVYSEADVPKELVEAHKQGPTIGYIGHLYPGKCMEVMMKIAQKMPDQTFHVIGGTDEWVRHWHNECNNRGINNIKFYGFIDNSKVNACYQYLDIVLLPFSDNIYYNKDKKDDIGKYISPLKLFEAMACGKAIVASKLISIEEVVNNGSNGLLVLPAEIDRWCELIRSLIVDEEYRKELGLNAKMTLEESYSWNKRAQTIYDMIKKSFLC